MSRLQARISRQLLSNAGYGPYSTTITLVIYTEQVPVVLLWSVYLRENPNYGGTIHHLRARL